MSFDYAYFFKDASPLYLTPLPSLTSLIPPPLYLTRLTRFSLRPLTLWLSWRGVSLLLYLLILFLPPPFPSLYLSTLYSGSSLPSLTWRFLRILSTEIRGYFMRKSWNTFSGWKRQKWSGGLSLG